MSRYHMSHRSPALFSRPLSHAHPARRHAHLSVRLYVHPVCTPLSVRLYVQHHTPAPGITSAHALHRQPPPATPLLPHHGRQTASRRRSVRRHPTRADRRVLLSPRLKSTRRQPAGEAGEAPPRYLFGSAVAGVRGRRVGVASDSSAAPPLGTDGSLCLGTRDKTREDYPQSITPSRVPPVATHGEDYPQSRPIVNSPPALPMSAHALSSDLPERQGGGQRGAGGGEFCAAVTSDAGPHALVS